MKRMGFIYDLVDIYQDHENDRMRQLAASALHTTGNDWAKNFLRQNVKYEENPKIKHIILKGVTTTFTSESFTSKTIDLITVTLYAEKTVVFPT